MESIWTKPEIQALGAERIAILKEAQQKCKGKSGLARLDVLLEYGERLAQGKRLSHAEQNALFCVLTESMSPQERQQLAQVMAVMGISQ